LDYRDFFILLYLVIRLVAKFKLKTMGYPTKIQLIKRAKSEQWYINFPSAVAQAMEFERGEIVEWLIDDHQRLVMIRKDENVRALKKKLQKKPKT
jgi:hypothetical protein